ncbi:MULTISPECIES: alpha/beta fold hydrolase [Rhodococcus]|uniref:AB hydrolase-1 domain-containing protein n=1 Tax=Rhodococcus opacus (strain B4) TaxID=632772 RepID=C1BD00_RHOOB|nr:alpha/beta hydrolase [Rhodococcus sp. T7]KAF0958196.1 hypothetical protein MLGJGCBP_08691 [Rhodococcus sp. T7]BAH55744.1 hypothetical protein ROP_pROB01-02450 [Rhodococcus opacus B4]
MCRDPALHTWSRYAADVIALLDHLGASEAVVGGTGLGGTIALRAAPAFPSRVRAVVVISAEDIEDDEAKVAETALVDRFAERVRGDGIEAAWELFLPHLQPLIGNLVRSAIPRADPGSVAAAAAIGRDRSFRTLDELGAIEVPVLIVPGADERHPAELAERMSATIPHATLARNVSFDALATADDLAGAVVPQIRRFLGNCGHYPSPCVPEPPSSDRRTLAMAMWLGTGTAAQRCLVRGPGADRACRAASCVAGSGRHASVTLGL